MLWRSVLAGPLSTWARAVIWSKGAWFLFVLIKNCPGGGPGKGRNPTRIFGIHTFTGTIQGVSVVILPNIVLVIPNMILVLPDMVLILPGLILVLSSILVLPALVKYGVVVVGVIMIWSCYIRYTSPPSYTSYTSPSSYTSYRAPGVWQTGHA